MKCNRSCSGLVALEIIAAITILTVVVIATFATVAPVYRVPEQHPSDTEIEHLNHLATQYFVDHGDFPDGLQGLIDGGYLSCYTPERQARCNWISRNYAYHLETGTFRYDAEEP